MTGAPVRTEQPAAIAADPLPDIAPNSMQDPTVTAALARVAGHVIAIEKDPELVRRLRVRFRLLDNVEIVEKDFLAYSLRTRRDNAPLANKIFASIPYNITAQVIRKILYERSNLDEGHLILQKEAARKFSGSPRETLFSILAKPFFEFQIRIYNRNNTNNGSNS